MQQQKNIIDCYNKTAKNYSEKFIDELSKKHLDRILLEAFAARNMNNGKLIDLGCGPGQTTKYLSDCGITDIVGIDISPVMVKVANNSNPFIQFETADILNLKYANGSFGSAIAFYSILHFNYEHVKTAFKEIKRILTANGQFLFSFHIGDKVLHLEEFLNYRVNIDFHFFETDTIIELLKETGFEIIDVIERQPYKDVEYESKRAYIWTKTRMDI